jgi:hypothetical protein
VTLAVVVAVPLNTTATQLVRLDAVAVMLDALQAVELVEDAALVVELVEDVVQGAVVVIVQVLTSVQVMDHKKSRSTNQLSSVSIVKVFGSPSLLHALDASKVNCIFHSPLFFRLSYDDPHESWDTRRCQVLNEGRGHRWHFGQRGVA